MVWTYINRYPFTMGKLDNFMALETMIIANKFLHFFCFLGHLPLIQQLARTKNAIKIIKKWL
jgi:hypothetical protein